MKVTLQEEPLKICVIGSGYVGLVAAVCFAEIGHTVTCVDNDEAKVRLLNTGGMPIFEKDLSGLLKKHFGRRLEFTADLRRAVEQSAAVFIAVGTPQGGGGSADLSYVEAVVSEVAQCVNGGYKVLVEKSTVPVYTNEWITRCMLRHGISREHFDVVSNPEFLREGSAVEDFLHPDRIVVGVNSDRSAALLRRIYDPLTSGRYYSWPNSLAGPLNKENPARLLVTSAQSAELIKHASNAFLAMKISFINVVANLAEGVGADIEEIASGMGLDRRIGTAFLRAGLGYGGSCFPKDVAAFSFVAQEHGVDFRILDDIQHINAQQRDLFFKKVQSALWTLRGKRVAALGLSFKGGTDDIRESPAIDVIRRLLAAGSTVRAYDPVAMERASVELPSCEFMYYASSIYEAVEGADAAIILTDWPEFRGIDLARLRQTMHFPIVVDGRNMFEPEHMRRNGFTYLSVGRPVVERPAGAHRWKASCDVSDVTSALTSENC